MGLDDLRSRDDLSQDAAEPFLCRRTVVPSYPFRCPAVSRPTTFATSPAAATDLIVDLAYGLGCNRRDKDQDPNSPSPSPSPMTPATLPLLFLQRSPKSQANGHGGLAARNSTMCARLAYVSRFLELHLVDGHLHFSSCRRLASTVPAEMLSALEDAADSS